MKNYFYKSILAIGGLFLSLLLSGQNTPPSCVITAPHSNAYFMEGTDITILVYASDLGGSQSGGSIAKLEFFVDSTLLGESSTGSDFTYSYVWEAVPAGTYRITARATDDDAVAFTSAGVLITVGSSEVESLGISAGRGKYLANIIPNSVREDFSLYWNGVTAENSCKWGSVEATRDVMNWSKADIAYNHALANHMSFRYHALAWGSQYPSWIETLTPAEFQEEMEEYMAAVSERYPPIDQLDVLNENMYLNSYNGEEHAAGTPYFREGLGGPGETGYDWAIWLFKKARFYFPNAKLVINDFELVTNSAGRNEILDLVKVLRDSSLIDGFGTQSHYFNIDGLAASSLNSALNAMATSGVPVYVTELDAKGNSNNEASQLSTYSTLFPVYWEHPAVAGITLWGYVEGATWSSGTGILNSNGTERSAMSWLRSYMQEQPIVGYPFEATIEIPDTLDNILANGEFDNGLDPWQLENDEEGMGSISIVSGMEMSGENALQLCVSEPGTEPWHVQLSQDAPFVYGRKYVISFIAKADKARSIIVTMQKSSRPFNQYMEDTLDLTTENQSFSIPFIPSTFQSENKLKFFAGLTTGCIYLDSIVFKEGEYTDIQEVDNLQNISVYPNPASSGKVFVENRSGEKIESIEILDMKGAVLLRFFPNQTRAELDLASLKGGLYFLKIHTKTSIVSKKIVIQ